MNGKRFFQYFSISLIILSSLYWGYRHFYWSRNLIISTAELPDGNTLWESRLTKLKQDLPESGKVGYISDWDLPDGSENTDLETEYRLTQYTLSPLVVTRGMDDPLIIGNITAVPFDEKLSDYFGVNIVKEYGFGIYLLEKR